MGLAEASATILGAVAVLIAGGRVCVWWIYNRGQVTERERIESEMAQSARAALEAKVDDLQARIAHLESELQSMRPKRWRV